MTDAPSPQEDNSAAAWSGVAGSVAAVAVDHLVAHTPLGKLAGVAAAVAGGGVAYALEHGGIMKDILDTLGVAPEPLVAHARPPIAPPEWAPYDGPTLADALHLPADPIGPVADALQTLSGGSTLSWPCPGIAGPVVGRDLVEGPVLATDCGTGLDPTRSAYEDVLHGVMTPRDAIAHVAGLTHGVGDSPCGPADPGGDALS